MNPEIDCKVCEPFSWSSVLRLRLHSSFGLCSGAELSSIFSDFLSCGFVVFCSFEQLEKVANAARNILKMLVFFINEKE